MPDPDPGAELSKGIDAGVASRLHDFNLTVGNSIVSAAWLIALAIVAAQVVTTSASYTLNSGAINELERERAAQARWYELRNAELEATIDLERLPTWSLAGFVTTAAGVEVSFPAVSGARTLFVQYLAIDNTGGGVLSYELAAGEGSVLIPSTALGTAWSPGKRIILNLEQRTPDGRSARYTGPGNVVSAP